LKSSLRDTNAKLTESTVGSACCGVTEPYDRSAAITCTSSISSGLRSFHNRQLAQNELASVGVLFRPATGRICAPLLWASGVLLFDN
jgi:hypothetical protein